MRFITIVPILFALSFTAKLQAQISVQEAQQRLAAREAAQKNETAEENVELRKKVEALQQEIGELKQENNELKTLLAASSPSAKQAEFTEKDAGDAFKTYCSKFVALLDLHVTKTKESRGNEEPQIYVTHWQSANAKMDVQKTNSVLTPFVGTLEMQVGYTVTASRDGKIVQKSDGLLYRFTFAGQEGKWVAKKYEEYDDVTKEWTSRQTPIDETVFGEILKLILDR